MWLCYTQACIQMEKSGKIKRAYTKKNNLRRFFFPKDWNKFKDIIENKQHKFFFEFLLHTGCRYNEAAHITGNDIDFANDMIFIKFAKGGAHKQRQIQMSSYLKRRIIQYIKENKMTRTSRFGFPSVQFLDKQIKRYAAEAEIASPADFSCHNLRKTLENWLCALNINSLTISAHMGHTLDVAQAHYIGSQVFTQEDKVLIKSILDDLLQKNK